MTAQGGRYPWMTATIEKCHQLLRTQGVKVAPGVIDGVPHCNGTYDGMLCWPPARANTSISHHCPPLKGLEPEKLVTKFCNGEGRWPGRPDQTPNETKEWGWTNYFVCLPVDPAIAMKVKQIAQDVRYVEFVCLSLSFLALVLSLIIFAFFRRLLVFRNLVHVHLMVSILLVTTIRFIIYIDVDVTQNFDDAPSGHIGPTINSSKYICEAFYAILEYAKCVAYAWMVLEGFYLHNSLVCHVFSGEPKIWKYCAIAWGAPIAHVTVWILVIVCIHGPGGTEKCFGSYYWDTEFWVLELVRLIEIMVNSGFLINIVRVLWIKMRDSIHGTAEVDQLRKSVKAAFMLIPLLGIPNVLQQIPIRPTPSNIKWWKVYLYICEITYTIQGFFISLIYCFTNKEVVASIKKAWSRYRMRHASFDEMRRGSKSGPIMYGASRCSPTPSFAKRRQSRSSNNNDIAAPPASFDDTDYFSSNNVPVMRFQAKVHRLSVPVPEDHSLATDTETTQLTDHNRRDSGSEPSTSQVLSVPIPAFDDIINRRRDEKDNFPELAPLMPKLL